MMLLMLLLLDMLSDGSGRELLRVCALKHEDEIQKAAGRAAREGATHGNSTQFKTF